MSDLEQMTKKELIELVESFVPTMWQRGCSCRAQPFNKPCSSCVARRIYRQQMGEKLATVERLLKDEIGTAEDHIELTRLRGQWLEWIAELDEVDRRVEAMRKEQSHEV